MDSLHFKEIGSPQGRSTIVIIHAASGPVVANLEKDYHLLLPDLPGYGESYKIRPFTTSDAANRIATIIRAHAANGRAHVIGMSLGMYVGLDLVTQHPDVVDRAFFSGYKRFPTTSIATMAKGFRLDREVQNWVPKSVVRWLMDGTDIETPVRRGENLADLDKEIAAPLCLPDDIWPRPWPAKTLLVCAGKSGILPTADHAAATIKLRDIARQSNEETVAYTHPKMRHPWHLQAPELYAQTARLWFEEGKVPEGFVEL